MRDGPRKKVGGDMGSSPHTAGFPSGGGVSGLSPIMDEARYGDLEPFAHAVLVRFAFILFFLGLLES